MSDSSSDFDTDSRLVQTIDRVLSVQRPVVLANVRNIRRRDPLASPEEVIRRLERHYLNAVTAGGAAVGASAVVPGVGVTASLALSTIETAGFLEASALFAQSVSEVHGIAVDDPERARALVMTMIIGSAGSDLVRQLAGQAAGSGPARNAYWGELVTKTLPNAMVGNLGTRLRKLFVRRFLRSHAGSIVGRVIPFGVGAVVGGAGNRMLGRKVVENARAAFGPAPAHFPAGFDAPIPLEDRQGRWRLPGREGS